jgi:hypothetical protein
MRNMTFHILVDQCSRRRRLLACFALALVIAPGLSSCAYTYVDQRGLTHVVGLVSVEIPRDPHARSSGASAVRVSSFGVSVFRSDLYSGISMGYNVDELLVLDDHACVDMAGQSLGSWDRHDVPTNTHKEHAP